MVLLKSALRVVSNEFFSQFGNLTLCFVLTLFSCSTSGMPSRLSAQIESGLNKTGVQPNATSIAQLYRTSDA
jgi:hypothetical protein